MLSTYTTNVVQYYRDNDSEKVILTNARDQMHTAILPYLPHKI